MTRKTVDDRFWDKVDVRGPDDCWLWLGADGGQGYGTFYVSPQRRSARAHRFAYELMVGPIPDGLTIDHLCRNRACVNPVHLEPVTNRENVLRGEGISAQRARKTHCPYGHPYDEENTYVNKNRQRTCRTCKRANWRAWYYRNKAELERVRAE